MNNTSKTRTLAECAVLIALGTILAQLKIYELPNGGSVTAASMVPFILVSLRHGPRWGLLTGFANSLLQMLLGGLWPTPAGTAGAMALEVIFDYLMPFTVLGLAYVFAKPFGEGKKLQGIICGTVCVCFLRRSDKNSTITSSRATAPITIITIRLPSTPSCLNGTPFSEA